MYIHPGFRGLRIVRLDDAEWMVWHKKEAKTPFINSYSRGVVCWKSSGVVYIITARLCVLRSVRFTEVILWQARAGARSTRYFIVSLIRCSSPSCHWCTVLVAPALITKTRRSLGNAWRQTRQTTDDKDLMKNVYVNFVPFTATSMSFFSLFLSNALKKQLGFYFHVYI